jgi:uncharacterized protein (DUF885 family)
MKSKWKAAFTALLILWITGARVNAQLKTNDKIQNLFENYYEERLKLFPLEATGLGDNRYNNVLQNDGSKEYLKQLNDFYTKYLAGLDSFKFESLNFEDQISFSILKYVLNRELKGLQFHRELMPFAQFSSLPLTMGQLGNGTGDQPFKNVQDYDNWLKRISAFVTWTDTTISNFRNGIKAGMVLPKALVKKMVPQYESLAQMDTSKNIFYGPVRHFPPQFSQEDKKRLRDAFSQAITEQLIPSYKKLSAFFSGEYMDAARTSSGINALPHGDSLYKFMVAYYTTTDKTPEEVYQTGLNEVRRITGEMEKLKTQMGFNGSLKELFNFMQTDKKFMPFATEAQVAPLKQTVWCGSQNTF